MLLSGSISSMIYAVPEHAFDAIANPADPLLITTVTIQTAYSSRKLQQTLQYARWMYCSDDSITQSRISYSHSQ